MGFRPLSGIQFSLPFSELAEITAARKFPSPLGDSILITGEETRGGQHCRTKVSVPSRGFNSHYAEAESVLDGIFAKVSVPSRGFNSHYDDDVYAYCTRPVKFPSPLGDSILITRRIHRLKLRAKALSVPSRGFNSHYLTLFCSIRRRVLFPSPLGDSILITQRLRARYGF